MVQAALLLVTLAVLGPGGDEIPPQRVEVKGFAPVEHLADELQELAPGIYDEVNEALGAPPLEKVRIELTSDLGGATDHGLDWHLPEWAAGAAKSDQGHILLTVHSDGQRHDRVRVLRHELAHVAIASAAGGQPVPRWFNEGLARYLAREQSTNDAQLLAQARLQDRLPGLEGLVRGFPRGRQAASLAYATSARAMELIVERGGTDAPRRILHGLAEGGAFEDVLEAEIGLRSWRLSARVRDSIPRWPALLTLLNATDAFLALGGLLAIVSFGRLRRKRREQLSGMEPDRDEPWPGLRRWTVRPRQRIVF